MRPVITIGHGKLEGTEERGVFVFRGIPYARPPVGSRRWRAPERAKPWHGTLSAVTFGSAAPQNDSTARLLSRVVGTNSTVQSEDCLKLNVWTPGIDHRRRPVMVWIHGGAFILGSGATPLYAGGRLAKRGDVVVVTINYRLGALGFLNLRALDDRLESNFGIRDQVAALEWVRDNIEEFGGDPENVTIFGESAGGMSVGTLLGTPSAKNLFHRAIAQSGAASNVSPAQRGTATAEEFLVQAGIKKIDVELLRKLSVAGVLAAQLRTSQKIGLPLGSLPWQPSIDDDVLPDMPLAAIAAGAAQSVRLIVGTNSDEWRLFLLADPKGRRLDEVGLRRRVSRMLSGPEREHGILSERAFETYSRTESGHRKATPAEQWVAFQSDRVFHYPAHDLAETHAQSGAGTYAYLFQWTPPLVGPWLGSFHGLEIPFVFGTIRDGYLRHILAAQRAARDLSDNMQRAWVSFARTGDPSHEGLPTWSPYAPSGATMHLGAESALGTRPYEHRYRFWSELMKDSEKPQRSGNEERQLPEKKRRVVRG